MFGPLRTAWLLGLVVGLCSIRSANAQWVKPNDPAYQRYPADPHQESLFLLRMEEAWKIEKGSPKVIIGVIDLAFDATHPDLKNQLWTNPKEIPGNGKDDDGNGFSDDIHGWDFGDGDNTLAGDQAEHGTHVAGIIAAEANNGVGVAGIAPGCRLMLVKVGLGGCLRDGAIMGRAIHYCADNGARLICMNHGLSEHYPGWHVPVGGQLKAACDYAYRKGVLIVSCTTSNDGEFYPAIFQPSYDSVMGTGASDIFGKPSGMYGGSYFCEAIAPGGQRDGGDHNPKSIYSCYCGSRQYHYYAGGCMATPHVAGLLALVLSHYPGLDVEQARQIVRNTAKSEKPDFDVRWGHGLIQPAAALSLRPERIAPRPALQAATPADTVANGKPVYVARVRNEGALDARVRLSLVHQGRKLADREATALGLKTTEVHFLAQGLPPAGELTVRMEALGMARPRVYDDALEVKLRIADEDLTIRQSDGRRLVVVAKVHNAGSVDAGRVAVILHHHEPAVAQRRGPPSRMLDAQVIAVPASGTAEAEFLLEDPEATSDLWAEIEQLDVGAPHVPKDRGKARLAVGDNRPQPTASVPKDSAAMQRAVSREGIEYLARLRKNTPFGTNDFDLAGLRAGMGSRREPTIKDVRLVRAKIGDIPGEWVLAPGAEPGVRLLYLHGGGFVSGSGGFYLALAAHLSAAAKCAVLLPDYRLAPEHRFPAGLEDCVRAHEWMIANGPSGPAPARATFIAGDSAGGNLTLATLLALRDRRKPLPAGGIAISPATDWTLASESLRTVNDPIISARTMPVFRELYLGKTDPRNPLASPVFGDYRGISPLLIQAGEHEMLRDDSVRVAKKARSDGISVKLEIWPGMFHVFQSHEPLLPEAREAIAHAADFMRSLLPR